MGIEAASLMGPDEIKYLTCRVIHTDDLYGGLYDSNEGYLDPNGTTCAYTGAAKKARSTLNMW